MVVSCHLLHSISGNPQLGNDEWTVLGGAGANRASADGRSARGLTLWLARQGSGRTYLVVRSNATSIELCSSFLLRLGVFQALLPNRTEISLPGFGLLLTEDLLPSLWSSPVGEATKRLVRQLDPQYVFTPDQIALRNSIRSAFSGWIQGSNVCSAVDCQFPLSPLAFCASTTLRGTFLTGC